MKSNKDHRPATTDFSKDRDARKETKLPPAKKNGKERYTLYSEIEDEEFLPPVHKESVFDYFDEEEEG